MKKILAAMTSAAMLISMLGTVSAFADSSENYIKNFTKIEMDAAPLKAAEEAMLPYQFDELSTQAQKCYTDIRKAILSHKNSVKVSPRISEKTLLTIADILRNQDPLTFGGTEITYNGISTDNAYARLTYAYTKGVDESIAEQTAKEADKVIAAFAPNSDSYAKLLAVHDHLTATAEKDENDPTISFKNAYGPLVIGKGSSEGYARAFQYICIKAGLTSVIVSGTDADGNAHSWNKVKLGDEWYNVDCFADDDENRHDLFMVCDETMMQFYTEAGGKDIPAANDKSFENNN
ncbi:MAG: transglutaminase domain-containing protein [Oscillospiraceae bacterium]